MEVACFSIILAAKPTFTHCQYRGTGSTARPNPRENCNEQLIRCVYKIAKKGLLASSDLIEIFLGIQLMTRRSNCATKPPAHPEDGDGVSSQSVGRPSHPDEAVCPRKFH